MFLATLGKTSRRATRAGDRVQVAPLVVPRVAALRSTNVFFCLELPAGENTAVLARRDVVLCGGWQREHDDVGPGAKRLKGWEKKPINALGFSHHPWLERFDVSLVEMYPKVDVSPTHLAVTVDKQASDNNSGKISAGATRPAQASEVYAWRAVLVTISSFVGFAPIFYYFFADGVWYYNIMFKARIAGPGMVAITGFHAFLGLAWTVHSLGQIMSGATRGDARRVFHRFMGRYVGPFAILALTVTACATDTHAMVLDPSKFSISRLMATYGLSAYTLAAFALAYHAALKKDYATHKDMIVFAITLSSLPGIQRIFWYVMQAALECEVTESVTARLQVRITLLIVMMTAFWRLGRFNKMNTSFLVIFTASIFAEIPAIVETGLHPCYGRRVQEDK